MIARGLNELMYPKIYIDLFRSFPRNPEVFVAMPFKHEFEGRWSRIYRPAIKACNLKPFRVKESVKGDSIPAEIVDHIGQAKLILADISDEFYKNDRTYPNPNVMYEVGIAHAVRLPEEVIIVRDNTSKAAPFDIKHIRWNSFDPADPVKTIGIIKKLIKRAEKEIDFIKDQTITKAMHLLDSDMIEFLVTVREYTTAGFDLSPFDPDRKGLYGLPSKEVSEEYLREMARKLIELGVLQVGSLIPYWQRVYGVSDEYAFTEMGRTLLQKILKLNLHPTKKDVHLWYKSFKRRQIKT